MIRDHHWARGSERGPVQETLRLGEGQLKPSKRFIDILIKEAICDEAGLWFVHDMLRGELEIDDPASLRRVTMECVREMLDTNLVVAADYGLGAATYERWNLDTAGVLDRIHREWDRLGRAPNIAEIVVFVGSKDTGLSSESADVSDRGSGGPS